MDKKTITIEGVGDKTNVIITEEKSEIKTIRKVIPYETLLNHINQIDESIARLEAEKIEYQTIINEADNLK